MNSTAKVVLGILVMFFIVKTCGSCDSSTSRQQTSSSQVAKTWKKSPVDELIKELNGEQNFSIILFDMDANESGSDYRHQYQVLIQKPDTVLEKKTDWKEVDEAFFSQHINDMGMEIATKKDGKLTKQAVPAGYNHYVGNEKYGRWENRGGSSFWAFYGQYAFMSSMFNMMTYRRSYWDDYNRGGYYGGSRGYYGPNSSNPVYGTKSYTSSTSGKSSTWGSKPNTFKDRVRTKVSRSSNQSSRFSSTRSKSSSTVNKRTSRSSSRYKSSRSTRSRSGGFGK
ncbi:hypothetical protein [Marinifilum caeruleilacunae]|uniref:Lipoprotein n=1 Tax=Marinifilum caeruleilacunae TaxID=2499076 RepID=A0ABX1WY87_9BACT|nr:hypothetical protein [Marinifilum caeruleilacunae]NOU61098.1 hypothetical protein [Marinifilum caeruleilacunae]